MEFKISSKSTIRPTTLLSKQWVYICSVGVLLYVAAIYILFRSDPLEIGSASQAQDVISLSAGTGTCELASQQEGWEKNFRYVLVGMSGSAVLVQLLRVIITFSKQKQDYKNQLAAYITALSIMLIHFSAEVIQTTPGRFSMTCEDSLGVRIPLVVLAEWQVTVPMMMVSSRLIQFVSIT